MLVYTRLTVIGEQNVGLRAPGSANLMCEYHRTGSASEEMAGLGGRWDLEESAVLLVGCARCQGTDTGSLQRTAARPS